MNDNYVILLESILNERLKMQRFVWERTGYRGYNVQNDYNKYFSNLEDLIDEHMELIDDHEYQSVLNIPFSQWEKMKTGI